MGRARGFRCSGYPVGETKGATGQWATKTLRLRPRVLMGDSSTDIQGTVGVLVARVRPVWGDKAGCA